MINTISLQVIRLSLSDRILFHLTSIVFINEQYLLYILIVAGGKRASQRSRGERSYWGGHWTQRPTQCSTHNWSWISVHISWLFTKWWFQISGYWQKLNTWCGNVFQSYNFFLLWQNLRAKLKFCLAPLTKANENSSSLWFLKLKEKMTSSDLLAFHGSHQVGFWWVKCKWIRNIRIKFPLQCTWVLNGGGKVLEAQCIYLPNPQTFKK